MLIVLIAILLFFCSLLMRIISRLTNRNFGIDTWYFLLYAEEFRNNRKLPVKLPYYLLDEVSQFYPPGFAIFLSIFSKKIIERYNWLVVPILDSLHLVLIFIFTYYLTFNLAIAVFTSLLYICSPVLISQGSTLNSRIFGSFLLSAVMINLYLFLQLSNNLNLVLSVFFGLLLFFSHKMSVQQFLFLTVGLSLIMLEPVFINVFILIFLLSILLGRRFYLNMLKSHFLIIKFWAKNLKFMDRHQIYQSEFYENLKKAQAMKSFKGLRSSKFIYTLERSKLIGIFLIIIFIYFFSPVIRAANFSFVFYWFVLNYFTIFCTSFIPGFKRLGEGHKYLIYGVFPSSFLLSLCLLTQLVFPFSYILLGLILAINMVVSLFIIKVLPENSLAGLDSNFFKIFDALKSAQAERILCLPFSKADAVAYFTKKEVLFGGHSLGWEKLDLFWPVLKKPIEYFIEEYRITNILIDKRYVDFEDLKLKFNCDIVSQAGDYTLYEVKNINTIRGGRE